MSWFFKIIIANRTQHLSTKYSIPIEQIQDLLQYDPTNGKYLEWIVKNYKSQQLRFPEDGSKTIETLTTFTKLQPVLKRNNVPIDINKYSYADLVRLIEQYGGQKSKREQYRINEVEGVKELLDFPPYKAVKVLTSEASAKLCRGTQWCVKDPFHFKDYSDNLIMVLKNGEPYYLLHERTKQYKDRYDEGLFGGEEDDEYDDNPEALEVLKTLHSSGIVKEPIDGDFGFLLLDLVPKEIILNSAELSFHYAKNFVGRFPEGERIMAQDAVYALEYAFQVLNGRFELGEPAISRICDYATRYAAYILRGRFELGEPAISTNAQYSYIYAKDALNGRFELGEPAISTSCEYSNKYAANVLKGRFERGEFAIATDASVSYWYALEVLRGRFPRGEPQIAKHPSWAYMYARNVIGGRFELAEETILNSDHKTQYLLFINNENIREMKYIGQCDRLRMKREGKQNEVFWQNMVNAAIEISQDQFLEVISPIEILDDDETFDQFVESNSDIRFFKSKWGSNLCYYIATGGFEFIWAEQDTDQDS